MQYVQKYITGISVTIVIAVLGYLIFQNPTSPQSDEVNTDTEKNNSILQLGIETDTGKRLETLANSGTNGNMSPFGSGKPLEKAEKKQVFQKPNTEWKTRTLNINGKLITYVFGEGNPKEAEPLSEKEKSIYSQCYFNTVVYDMDCPPSGDGDVGQGYVTADIEKDFLALLSHPLWNPILTICEQQFRQNEYSDWGVSYDQIMYTNFMDMENMISINPETGRKEIKYGNFSKLRNWFNNALRERKEIFGTATLKINNCITQNGGFELSKLMDTLYQKQFYPEGNYPSIITNPDEYIPLH